MIISKIKSKLDGNISLFDVQTNQTANGKFDLVVNPQGQLNRIIGIDKLVQHILKYMFVEKETYSNKLIGTNLNKPFTESENSLKNDIISSLAEYSKYQVANSKIDKNILGWNIFRTQTPDNQRTWKQINKSIVINNFYYDKNLNSNEVYYYSVVKVTNILGKPVNSAIGSYIPVLIPTSNTMDAIVSNSFIVIPKYGTVTLYWKKGIEYQSEEVLRSITKMLTWLTPGEPRNLNIYLQLTNLAKQATEVTTGITV